MTVSASTSKTCQNRPRVRVRLGPGVQDATGFWGWITHQHSRHVHVDLALRPRIGALQGAVVGDKDLVAAGLPAAGGVVRVCLGRRLHHRGQAGTWAQEPRPGRAALLAIGRLEHPAGMRLPRHGPRPQSAAPGSRRARSMSSGREARLKTRPGPHCGGASGSVSCSMGKLASAMIWRLLLCLLCLRHCQCRSTTSLLPFPRLERSLLSCILSL